MIFPILSDTGMQGSLIWDASTARVEFIRVSPENVEDDVWRVVIFLRFCSCAHGEALTIRDLRKQRMARICLKMRHHFFCPDGQKNTKPHFGSDPWCVINHFGRPNPIDVRREGNATSCEAVSRRPSGRNGSLGA